MSVLDRFFINNASTNLSNSISSAATSILVTNGSLFSAAAGKHVIATITEGSAIEIVQVTAVSGNTLTVVRGQEGTTPSAFTNLANMSVRITADTLNSLVWEIREILNLNRDWGTLATLSAALVTEVLSDFADKYSPTFKPDGTKLYFIEDSTVFTIVTYTLSTAWDISTISTGVQTTLPEDINGESLCFSSDGSKLYVPDGSSIHQFNLSTAWNLSTATYVGIRYVTGVASSDVVKHMKISSDGTYILWAGKWDSASTTDMSLVRQELGTPYTISTLATIAVSAYTMALTNSAYLNSFNISTDGTKVLVQVERDSDDAYLAQTYTLTTPFSFTSVTVGENIADPLVINPIAITFTSEPGAIVGDSDSKVFTYNFDTTTLKTYTW